MLVSSESVHVFFVCNLFLRFKEKIFQLAPHHFKFHIDPNSKKIHLHFLIFSFQFSNFNLELSEPSPNLPRTFPVATPFLPRSYLVATTYLERILNVPCGLLPRIYPVVQACYPLTIGLFLRIFPIASPNSEAMLNLP